MYLTNQAGRDEGLDAIAGLLIVYMYLVIAARLLMHVTFYV